MLLSKSRTIYCVFKYRFTTLVQTIVAFVILLFFTIHSSLSKVKRAVDHLITVLSLTLQLSHNHYDSFWVISSFVAPSPPYRQVFCRALDIVYWCTLTSIIALTTHYWLFHVFPTKTLSCLCGWFSMTSCSKQHLGVYSLSFLII